MSTISTHPNQLISTPKIYAGLALFGALIAYSSSGNEMLSAAAKTAFYAAVGATGGGMIGYLGATGFNPLTEENVPQLVNLVSITASGFAIANTVISIADSGTIPQQMGSVPVAGLTAGLSGFYMGKSYVAAEKKATGLEPESFDFAYAGLRSAVLTFFTSYFGGASASIVKTLTACSCIGSAVHAYKAKPNQNSQRSLHQSI